LEELPRFSPDPNHSALRQNASRSSLGTFGPFIVRTSFLVPGYNSQSCMNAVMELRQHLHVS